MCSVHLTSTVLRLFTHRYLELQQLGEALNPWVVGCFGPDKDAEEIAESQRICEKLLQKYKL